MALGAAAIGGIVAGGSALVNGLGNLFSSANTNKANQRLAAQQNEYNLQLQDRQFQYNTQASELEYQRNLEQWMRENEYNTPAAQMQRYINAGLNPNLIYGSGSSAGVAGTSPQYTAARYNSPKAERATNMAPRIDFDPYQAVSIANQLSIQKAQADNLEAQAEYTRAQTDYKRAEIDNHLPLHRGNLLSNQASYLQHSQSLNHANFRLAIQRIDQLERENPIKVELLKQTLKNLRTTNDLDSLNLELSRIGINNSDDLWQRIAARIFLNFRDKSARDSFINKLFN